MDRVARIKPCVPGQRFTLAAFERIVHPLARQIGASVVAFNQPDSTPNFYAAMLDEPQRPGPSRRIYLLRSDHDAWAVAMPRHPEAGPAPGWSHLHDPRFVDHAPIAAAMADLYGIELWSAQDLSQPVPADFPYDAPGDPVYWKPQRLSDALFNWWD